MNDFINNCRTCESLCITPFTDLTLDENKYYIQRLKDCTGLDFHKNDPLPKILCTKCTDRLNTFYQFRIRCLFVEQKYRNAIQTNISNVKSELVLAEILEDDDDVKNCTTDMKDDDNDAEDNGFIICKINIKDDVEMINDNLSEDQYTYIDVEDVIDEELIDDTNVKDTKEEFIENCDVTGTEECVDDYAVKSVLDEENKQNESILNHDYAEEFLIDSQDESEGGYINFEYLINDMENVESEAIQDATEIQENTKKSFVCGVCNLVLSSPQLFQSHKKTHKHYHKCELCQRSFTSAKHLLIHNKRIHEKIELFICEICEKSFSNKRPLKMHIRTVHLKDRLFSCEKCGKPFATPYDLNLHVLGHLNLRQFKCSICEKAFNTKPILKKHMNQHEGKVKNRNGSKAKVVTDFRYECQYCGMKSQFQSKHFAHMKTHSDEKPFNCSQCDKTFKTKEGLRVHTFVHTGERPEICDKCGMSFRTRSILNEHQLVHTGERAHKCEICEKSFPIRSTLTKHMRIHTGETPYHCKECPMQFKLLATLKKHHAKLHSEE